MTEADIRIANLERRLQVLENTLREERERQRIVALQGARDAVSVTVRRHVRVRNLELRVSALEAGASRLSAVAAEVARRWSMPWWVQGLIACLVAFGCWLWMANINECRAQGFSWRYCLTATG